MMCRILAAGVTFTVIGLVGRGHTAEPAARVTELRSQILMPGVQFMEAKQPVTSVQLTVHANVMGNGSGLLILGLDTPKFNEFGSVYPPGSVPPLRLECSVRFIKKGPVQVKVGTPHEEWQLFQITGPKIKTLLFVATPGPGLAEGRLIVWRDDKTVGAVVPLTAPSPGPALPCHPGCFPAGTLVAVPGGVRSIETVKRGDLVITVGQDAKAVPRRVTEVFTTRNRLLEVRTDSGILATTETQPLCQVEGEFRSAGKLVTGDRIWQWAPEGRRAAVVREVTPAGREVQVYNLVIDERTVFCAGGFMARCKPPAANTARTETPGVPIGAEAAKDGDKNDPKQVIVGKWQSNDGARIPLEFFADGTAKEPSIKEDGKWLYETGRYTVSDEGDIDFKWTGTNGMYGSSWYSLEGDRLIGSFGVKSRVEWIKVEKLEW